jgi:hypothetical protein
LWFVQRGTLCCGEFSIFLKKFQTMKANLKVILSVVGLAALQTEVLGLTAKAGHPNRQRRSLLFLRGRTDSRHLHRVAMASAEPLRPGTRGVADTFSYPPASHSYFISKTQESVLSKRPDITKTSAKWAFLAQIAFAGTDTRHPSG